MSENKQNPDPKFDESLYQGALSEAPYPLSLSSPKINPVDKRLVKANALETMKHQGEQQIALLRRQAELLILQAREIENRLKVSEEIYKADLNFEPVIGTVYHKYRKGEKTILSLVAPHEWGKLPYDKFECSVRLLADKSWEIVG